MEEAELRFNPWRASLSPDHSLFPAKVGKRMLASRQEHSSAAPAGEKPGDEGNSEQRKGTDSLHRLADALVEQADAFAGSGGKARRLPHRPPSCKQR